MINILLIVLSLLFIFYITFLIQILRGLKRLSARLITGDNLLDDTFISVIIPFRNEEENILKGLQCMENQTLPPEKFEVIYVNDKSTDSSLKKLHSNIKTANIKVLNMTGSDLGRSHKKKAVQYGIDNAKGDIIVTTDADCFFGPGWLKTLTGCFTEKTGFVSGPVEFQKSDNLFERIQRTEFAGLILAGAGLIGFGKPAICNGANLAFRKKLFEKVGGYEDNMELSSGEDEFLMQKIARQTDADVSFCWDRDALVTTGANQNWREFFRQRRRWASKGLFYKDKILILNLILLYFFYIGIVLQLILGIVNNYLFLISLGVTLFAKIILEYIIIKLGIEKIFDKNIKKDFLLAEFFQISYIVIIGFIGLFGNYEWKGRRVKR